MKIIIFIENNQAGGLDTFCINLLKSWPDADEFLILCNESHPGKFDLLRNANLGSNFVIHDLPLSWDVVNKYFCIFPANLRRILQPLFRVLLMPFQLSKLKSYFLKLDGDVLISLNGGYPGGETCRLANIAWAQIRRGKSKVNVHSFHGQAVYPHFGLSWYENYLDKLLIQSVTNFVTVSRACANSMKLRSAFHDYCDIEVIYNGVFINSKESNKVVNLRKELNLSDSPACLMLANYVPSKGHQFIFQAFDLVQRSIPNAHLVCCGAGSEIEKRAVINLSKSISTAPNVHILDFIQHGAELIEQFDLLLIGSQYFESFGLTAAEAMLRGVPVVATRVGGLSEVLGEPATGGYLIDKGDAASFALQIIALLSDSELRKKVGATGIARVKYFLSIHMAKKYKELLMREVNFSEFRS